jgi:predicted RNA-binding Zn-ribbon protein involved in translation (DUF1610 family)
MMRAGRRFVCANCGTVETLHFMPDSCSSCGGSIFPEQWLPQDSVHLDDDVEDYTHVADNASYSEAVLHG